MSVTAKELQKELNHKPMAQYLAEAISSGELVQVYKDGLRATKPERFKVKGRISPIVEPPEEWTCLTITDEEAVYEVHRPDHSERRQMAHQVHKLQGDYPAEEHHITSDFSQIMAEVIGEVDGRAKGKLPSQMANGNGVKNGT